MSRSKTFDVNEPLTIEKAQWLNDTLLAFGGAAHVDVNKVSGSQLSKRRPSLGKHYSFNSTCSNETLKSVGEVYQVPPQDINNALERHDEKKRRLSQCSEAVNNK
jgi:hypothetical protein